MGNFSLEGWEKGYKAGEEDERKKWQHRIDDAFHRGMSMADLLAKVYEEGKTAGTQQEVGYDKGYMQAEKDYFERTEKDRQASYDAGYEIGKADAKAEHDKECDRCQYSLRKEVIEEVREDATDEFRAKVSKDIEIFAEKVKSQVYDLVLEVEKFAERMKEQKE